MYMPSIFGESLFDNMFPFDEKFFTEKKDPLYGKNVSRLMKTDVRETEKTYELDIDLPGFKKDEIQIELKDQQPEPLGRRPDLPSASRRGSTVLLFETPLPG